ncbi:50S ribosomal protein L25 [Patescibacteria group bacterium]|nr:50S ribosomal protein L25 [Patescibacteria group bacterium]
MVHKRESLKAEKRTITGKKVRQLRKEGLVPASIYGKGMTSLSVQLPAKETEKVFAASGESALVDLMLDGETWPILFKNPQYDPLEGNLLHIDLHKVNLKEKITAEVPIVITGESEAVKAGNVLMEINMVVEVEALPTDLPENFVVDISSLKNIDDAVTVADLAVEKDKVEIKNAPEQIIVKIAEPKEEVIEEVATPAPSEVPATEQKAPEEGEAAGGETAAKEEKKKE